MKGIKKGLAILLVLCTLLSLVFVAGAAPMPQSADADQVQATAANDGFMKMVLLDGGRGYISVENVKAIIDEMALCDYDYLMLGIGNDGLRFLLNDMSVGEYNSDTIKKAIVDKNNELAPQAMGEWSEDDMNTILAHAQEKGISIVPMLNTPGHATSIVAAMEACGIKDCSLASSGTDTKNITINIENKQAAAFAEALVKKYIQYFSAQSCTYFNLGCDEYGGNAGNTQDKTNQAITAYVTDLCNAMTAMTPMAFTDVLCACSNVPNNLIGIHWYKNKLQNNSNVRANSNWYYVVGTHGTGNQNEWATYEKALKCVATDRVAQDYAGSLLAIWNDNNRPFSAEEVENVKTLIRTQATNNPMCFTLQSKEPDATVKDVYVQVGKTSDPITIPDVNYANDGPYTTDDPSIATVTVTGENEIPDTRNYTKASVTCNTLISSNSDTWQPTGRYYTPDGTKYYPLYAKRSSSISWFQTTYTYTWGYSKTGSASDVTQIGNVQSTKKTSDAPNPPVYTESGTKGHPAYTTVTFNGVKEGITYATVGDVPYTIHVVPQEVANVTRTYHPWISSFAVYPEGYTGEYPDEGVAHNVELQAMYAYSEKGIAFSDLVAPTGDWRWEEDAQTVYWKGTILPEGNHQDTRPVKDKSMAGTDFTYIRYWDGTWSYSSDQINWTQIQSTDEVCAYYLQKTQVTTEVNTYVKDWAFTAANANTKHDRPAQKALSFAVVYPGEHATNPKEDQIYQQSTLIYWDNTAFGFIRIQPNENYEIEKITYTMGKRTSGTNGSWNPNETIKWNEKTVPGSTEPWYDETICWDENYDTEPVVNSASVPNITDKTWGADDAVLILIYLRPVVKEDSLIVKYWDDASNAEITKYAIQTSHESTAEEKTFWNSLNPAYKYNQADKVYPDGLASNAYVTNLNNVNEYIQQDLTKVTSVYGKYTSGLYNYVGAEISRDGKTLTLHYNLNKDQLKPYYVADFGLPVEISFSDLGTGVTTASVSQPSNGTAEVKNGKIIYQPSRAYSGPVVLSVKATFEVGDPQLYNVGIYPATTVYYEETFMEGSTIGPQPAQQSLAYGNKSDHTGKYNYGYDAAYLNNTKDSNGTVAELNAGEEGRFTFTGTGVDVYACTKTDSGKVMIYVYQGTDLKRLITVDTRQRGDQSANGTAYNVPIVSLSDLEHGEYTLVMKEVQTKLDNNSKENYPVYIDGFRVHGTLDVVNTQVYKDDNEANPTFVELRNAVLAGLNVDTSKGEYAQQIAQNAMSQVYASSETTNGAVVLDAKNTTISVNDLLDKGPKNELYLRNGQAVVFKIADGYDNVQVGLKALNGSVNYTMNGTNNSAFATSTDMFYKVTPDNDGVVAITNNGEGILSITEVKVIGASASTASVFAPLSANDLMPALLSMGFESEPVAATATLNITVQCGDKAVPVTLTADGMSGDTHTFTAAEIKAAVEKALPEGYNVDDVTFSDVTVTCGESADVSFTAAQTQTPDVPTSTIGKIIAVAKRVINRIIGWFR